MPPTDNNLGFDTQLTKYYGFCKQYNDLYRSI